EQVDKVPVVRRRTVLGVGSGGHRNTFASASDGVWKSSVCRGRPLSSAAMVSRSSWVRVCRLVVLGRYWRNSPLVFSLLPRCHGLFGSQKYTATPVATLKRACSAISLPWSQVNERAS